MAEMTPAPAYSTPDPALAGAPGGRRWRWGRILVFVLVIGVLAAGAALISWELGSIFTGQALVVGIIAAMLPVPILVLCYLWLDRYEPEPAIYLLFCFTWGAVVATYVALKVNTAATHFAASRHLDDALVAVIGAPAIEETMKALGGLLGPLLLLWFRRRQISGVVDGLVYCGMSATGFAMVENIIYLGKLSYQSGVEQYGEASGVAQLLYTFVLRVFLSGFAHPLFTAFTGIGIGIAARAASRWVRWLAPFCGLLIAMILHGTWNLIPSLVQATGQRFLLLYGYFAIEVPIFFAMVGFALWVRGYEGRLTVRVLPAYARAGWFTPPEVAALASLGRRHAARTWAKRVAGDAGRKAMSSFQYAATRLALVRDGIDRGLNTSPKTMQRAVDDERLLLEQLSAARSVFVGRDPQTPQAVWTGSAYQLAFPDGVTRTVAPPPEPVVPIPVYLPPPPPPPPLYGYGYGHGWNGR